MLRQLRDRVLLAEIKVLNAVDGVREAVRDAVRGRLGDERGQTPTEYLMIVGLMAVVILFVFVSFFWNTIRSGANQWSTKVNQAIMGQQIQPQ